MVKTNEKNQMINNTDKSLSLSNVSLNEKFTGKLL